MSLVSEGEGDYVPTCILQCSPSGSIQRRHLASASNLCILSALLSV